MQPLNLGAEFVMGRTAIAAYRPMGRVFDNDIVSRWQSVILASHNGTYLLSNIRSASSSQSSQPSHSTSPWLWQTQKSPPQMQYSIPVPPQRPSRGAT